MKRRNELGSRAMATALKLRCSLGYKLEQPLCIFDLIEKHQIETRFAPIRSLEGMYSREGQAIILSSLRPAGRQRFTAAHELGHHIFEHGTRADELADCADTTSPDERLANLFAGYLLMPRVAVSHAFHVRGLSPQSALPRHFYQIAGLFGVGYETLVKHMEMSLDLLTPERSTHLQRTTPAKIRSEISGETGIHDLFLADRHWLGRPIDLRVGDAVLVSNDCLIDLPRLSIKDLPEGRRLYIAEQPGIVRLTDAGNDWAAFIRICRRDYEGRSLYRHQEAADDDG